MYQSAPDQTLALTLELDYSSFPEIQNVTQIDLNETVFVVSGIVQMFKASELKVIRVDLSEEESKDINFNKIHIRPRPPAYFTHPLAMELIFLH